MRNNAKDSQFALLGVLPIIAQINGPVATSRQEGIMSCFARLGHNGDTFLVAGNQHSHMVGHLDLQASNDMELRQVALTL